MSWRPTWWLSFLTKVWPITGLSAKATQIPVIGKILSAIAVPLFSGRNFNVTYLPINQELKSPQNVYLPLQVLEEVIKRSAYRVTINRCHCRDSKGCKNYPIENSCLLIGQGTMGLAPWIAQPLGVGEAIAHARHMVGLGLTPMIGRVRMDNLFYGIPNSGTLLTVCFCCHCCCTIMSSARYLPQKAKDSIIRLKGMTIMVDEQICKDCRSRECLEGCIVKAFTFEKGRVFHDAEKCKGCGWCVSLCPHKAVSAEVADMKAAVEEVIGRIESMINYSA